MREPDGVGGYTESWEALATVWCEVTPLSAKERMFADKLEQLVTHRIKVRHLLGLDATMRILFKGRIFQIQGIINPNEQGRFIEIMAAEGAGS